MGYELRDYQRRMVDAVLSWFCDEGNKGKAVCLVAPTGSGKTALSAAITEEVGGKALLLTHTKELIEQDGEAMAFHSPKRSVGYYSASIGRKDLSCDTTCAGIASMYRCKDLPSFDLVLIDEAHLINNRDEGMYRQLLSRIWEVNPNAWIAGLTATPYRLGQGMLTDDGFFSDIIDVVSVRELQDKGYLAHLTSKWTETHYDFSKLRVRGGEFRDDDVQKAVSVFKTNEQVADEIVRKGEDRNAWLVFCAGVAHAETMCTLLNERGIPTACVTGETPKAERERIIEAYKAGEYRCLTNMRILTTGFNYPDIDMVALLAPTLSPGLYSQQIGRGLRLKSDRDRTCLVLDFAGNVLRHGPVDDIQPPSAKVKGNGVAPCKVCPVCSEIVHASARICPSCGHEFPQKDKTWLLDGTVEVEKTEERKEKYYTTYVGAWRWDVYTTKNGRQCLRVRYFSLSKADRHISEMFFIWNNVSVARRNEDVIRLSSLFQEMGYQGDNDLGMMLRVLNVTRPPVKVLWKNEKGYPVLVKRFWGAAA